MKPKDNRPHTSVSRTQRSEIHEIHAEYKGPIPPPDALKNYGQVDPSFPERIMAMAEREQAHRHKLDVEQQAIIGEDLKQMRSERRFGQMCGLLLGLIVVAGSSACAYFGQSWVAGILGTTGLAGLVGAFFVETHQRSKQERQGPPE
jgi:uncharacterized membrane protein